MTTITVDLAEILESKFQHGLSIPVSIDVSDLLDYADDDWSESLDLDLLLAERQEAALIISAKEAKRVRPHLSDEQAWEVAQITRDQTLWAIEDFLGDVADENYPTGKQLLQRRAAQLKARFGGSQTQPSEADELLQQLAGLHRLIAKLPEDDHGNPALEGTIAATLDDIEQLVDGLTLTTKEG
jgi:hypothetical protein